MRVLVLLCVVTSAACSAKQPGAAASSPALERLAAMSPEEKARSDSARLPWTAADARFMTDMIGHHGQAIVMARMAPSHGASATIQTLAERIINAQQDEIRIMQTWLRVRGQPVPEAGSDGHAAHHGGAHHEATMPGMLTAEQLAALDSARGTEFDRRFLVSMIQHHRGAVSMVKALFATDGAGQDETVFKFASDVNVDQATEIARMERMLVVWKLENPGR